MIRHLLLMEFVEDCSPQQLAELEQAFLEMPSLISGVLSVEWGENNSPEGKNKAYSHCVVMSFSGEAGRQNYLPHPEHDKLKAKLRPMLKDIIVLDYGVANSLKA